MLWRNALILMPVKFKKWLHRFELVFSTLFFTVFHGIIKRNYFAFSFSIFHLCDLKQNIFY